MLQDHHAGDRDPVCGDNSWQIVSLCHHHSSWLLLGRSGDSWSRLSRSYSVSIILFLGYNVIKTSPSLTVSWQLTSDWPITHLQLMHSTHFIAHFPILSSRAINVDNILYNLHLILTYWGWFDGQINVQIPIIYDLLNGNLFYLIQTRLDLLEISNET